MESSYLALIEFFVVAAFVVGWGVLEIVGLRLDKKREREKREASRDASDKS